MGNNGWARTDRIMRWLHLYTGLFLAPWMLVYAGSAFCLNHGPWFAKTLGITPPEWESVQETDFVPDDAFPQVPEEQARAILKHLDLDGAHRLQGQPTASQMVIFRISGGGNYRVTWHRDRSLLSVHRQRPFSFYRLMHFLHFRGGYGQPYAAHVAWAIIVDAVALSMGTWVLSGVYIWARRPKKRLLGGVCVAGGTLLFMGLVFLLCS